MSSFKIRVNKDDLDLVRKILTEERLRLIQVIKERNPKSIYELARILNRNRSSVMRDLKHLRSIGLIEFDDSGKRNRKKPIVRYEEINIVISL